MAARKTRTITIKPLDVTHTLASAKPHTCGEAFTVLAGTFGEKADLVTYAAEGCKRLPRHNGEHKADKPRGLMTAAQRARLTKAARQPKAATGKAARKPRVTRASVLEAAQQLAAGELSATAYMSLVSAYGQRRTRKALDQRTSEAPVA